GGEFRGRDRGRRSVGEARRDVGEDPEERASSCVSRRDRRSLAAVPKLGERVRMSTQTADGFLSLAISFPRYPALYSAVFELVSNRPCTAGELRTDYEHTADAKGRTAY